MLIFSFSQQNLQLSDQPDHGFPTKKTPTLPTLPPFCRSACLKQQIRLTASKLGLSHSGCSCLFQSKALFCIFNQGDCPGLASSAASSPLQVKGWLRKSVLGTDLSPGPGVDGIIVSVHRGELLRVPWLGEHQAKPPPEEQRAFHKGRQPKYREIKINHHVWHCLCLHKAQAPDELQIQVLMGFYHYYVRGSFLTKPR